MSYSRKLLRNKIKEMYKQEKLENITNLKDEKMSFKDYYKTKRGKNIDFSTQPKVVKD